jgi:hypothetical protein
MYVTINEVTALAQTVIPNSDERDRNIWNAWTYQCLLQLGIGDDEIKVAEILPQDYTGLLPEDCRYVIEFSLFDSAGNQLPHSYRTGKQRIYTDTRLPQTATTNGLTNCVPVDVATDATAIHLGTNGENVARILLRYFAYPIDENGMPLIREEDTMACVYFIRYMQGMRQDDNRSKIQQDQQTFFMEADRARARKKMASMSPDKARTVLTSMMSMIPNFRSIQGF